jgi:hypothetical protein
MVASGLDGSIHPNPWFLISIGCFFPGVICCFAVLKVNQFPKAKVLLFCWRLGARSNAPGEIAQAGLVLQKLFLLGHGFQGFSSCGFGVPVPHTYVREPGAPDSVLSLCSTSYLSPKLVWDELASDSKQPRLSMVLQHMSPQEGF